jgi:hypothetical protein
LNTYSSFAVSDRGFIRLGSDIASNTPEEQDDVIVPVCNGTDWDAATYKLTGTAPNRKLIIQWTGVMQPSGEATSFQLWLSERIGKIEFVYQSIRKIAQYPYKVFCKKSIMQQSAVAALQVVAHDALPPVSYAVVPLNHDSIYPKTRYTFQPDTVRPANPSGLGFTNVMAGCLTVQFNDNSTNEYLFQLERSDDNTSFFTEKKIFVTNAGNTGLVNHNQTGLQPFWNYRYRVFASNGFLNSDTLVNTAQTLMPMINGIKQIPGDYASVTQLVQDAACKHLGPDLVIELQNNYSFAAETLPVTFPKSVQNRFIRSITIRPAANATITWAAYTNSTLLYVDSVRHVILDGRPGGVGTARNFTIFQQNPVARAIQYFNAADSGVVTFCNVLAKNNPTSLVKNLIVAGPTDSANLYTRKNVNAFTLSDCFISAEDGKTTNLVYIKSTDSTGSKGLRIINNEFSRFVYDAIFVEHGGEQALIAGNRFYQPVPIVPVAYLPIASAACIKLVNTEKARISGNYFGGSGATWGQGKYTVDPFSSSYHFIHYQNDSKTKQAEIVNNQFGNIHIKSDAVGMIYASGGSVRIDSNRVGTTDSLHSITSAGRFYGFELWFGKKYLSRNFFSGLHAQYPNLTDTRESYFITALMTDSFYLQNNDIGGSNDYNANTSFGRIYPLYGPPDGKVVIKGNQFRGMFSRGSNLEMISYNHGITSEPVHVTIDSNSFHHLRSPGNVTAIDALLNTGTTINRISNNEIYALYSSGELNGLYGPEGNMKGINVHLYEYTNAPGGIVENTELQIYGNRVHSFVPIRVLSNSKFYVDAMEGSATKYHVWNNDIRLGIDVSGQPVDSVGTFITGVIIGKPGAAGNRFSKVEHNSIYIGGRGHIGSAIFVPYSTGPASQKSLFVTNNIIQIDRHIPNSAYPLHYSFQYTPAYTVVSGKNLWYSSSLPNVQAMLDAYRQSCHCDSASFVGNPSFVNATGDSAHFSLALASGSMADSAGTPSLLPVTTDIDGIVRAHFSPIDIGSHAVTPCAGGTAPTIHISVPVADTIFLCANPSATITASLSGGSFQQLQWQRDLYDIPGATGTSLTVTRAGVYRLVGKNACLQAASRHVAVVTTSDVTPAPGATVTTVCAGTPVTFTAAPVYQGTAPVYQWQVNDVNAGTNSPVFVSSTLNNNDQVKVTVTNTTTCLAWNTGTSHPVTITVNPSVVPSISIGGPSTVLVSQLNRFDASVNQGIPSPAYQWQDSTHQHSWQDISGALLGTLYYSPALTGHKLRCRLTGSGCINPAVVYSNVITFTVNLTTGINDPAIYGIRFFPNPTADKLVIDKLKLSDQWQTAVVSSLDGKQNLVVQSLVNQTQVRLDVQHLPAGVYMVSLIKKSGVVVKGKFVKM